jgi:type IV secretory pathway ATPase VirB11/archaellum biosynthesis ATPase
MVNVPGGNSHDNGRHGDEAEPTPDARRAPRFLAGSRQISLAALQERIEEEFIAGTVSRPDILLEAADEPARRELVREVVDYVLAVEGIKLARSERLAVLDLVYRELFSFGPLDAFLRDDTVTELTIDGPERVYVRHGADDLVPVDSYFDDMGHLERIVQRVLSTAGAQLSEGEPFLEVGTRLAGRPARLTVAAPPASPVLNVEIRLHPSQAATLDSCMAREMLDADAAALLKAIVEAGHGLMIVGDAGAGKTTLLEALLAYLPGGSIAVERAAEMRIPAGMERIAAIPPAPGQPPVDFASQITAALDKHPAWLLLDEVRFDEAPAMWAALTRDHRPRCLWAFRGATNPLRLRTAFGMSVRRAQPGIDQEFIHSALLDRLPFVGLLGRQEHRLRVLSIGEWQRDQPESLASITLQTIWPASGAQPLHALNWSR